MKAMAIVLATLLVLFLLDRVALWMERRGWIYWRHSRASPGTLGNPFLELESLLEPGPRQLLEARHDEHVEEHEGEDPPEPGRRSGSSDE